MMASVCDMCVCVQVYALRENVNVVMNPGRTLVIGAIDRNHLMILGMHCLAIDQGNLRITN